MHVSKSDDQATDELMAAEGVGRLFLVKRNECPNLKYYLAADFGDLGIREVELT